MNEIRPLNKNMPLKNQFLKYRTHIIAIKGIGKFNFYYTKKKVILLLSSIEAVNSATQMLTRIKIFF